MGTTCCFATQDKVWVTGFASERWEVYTVPADSDTLGVSPKTLAAGEANSCGTASEPGGAPASAACR